MNYSLSTKNKKLDVIVTIGGSKSETNRALIIKALAEEDINIYNLSNSEDTKILMEALASDEREINVGMAGTAMRFLTAYYALKGEDKILTGTKQMLSRPIKVLVEALQRLGADVSYLGEEGYPPLLFGKGNIKGGKIEVDSSISSQYISALMMIAPYLKDGLQINLTGTKLSLPYMQMTAAIMQHFGAKCTFKDATISISEGAYLAKEYTVEPDWSSAAYWYQLAAFSDVCRIELKGLKKESYQGDRFLVELYESFGVKTNFTSSGLVLYKEMGFEQNKKLFFDLRHNPDLAQSIAVTCLGLGVEAQIDGLYNLSLKETNRIKALENELTKLGGYVELLSESTLKIMSPETINEGVSIETYNDHRMAMAFAPLALLKPITIKNIEVVKKSYPNFWEHIKKAGFTLN